MEAFVHLIENVFLVNIDKYHVEVAIEGFNVGFNRTPDTSEMTIIVIKSL
jgi:hypothetical protein